MGSVRPCTIAMTGARYPSLNCRASRDFCPTDFAADQFANQFTIAGPYISGVCVMASVPPQSTRLERPATMFM